jgi:hypothetical protein
MGVEYWRSQMVRAQDKHLRLAYSQRCDRWLVRYYRLQIQSEIASCCEAGPAGGQDTSTDLRECHCTRSEIFLNISANG